MYLSPRVTSDSLRGLKRHITLMLHSAGSAILGQRRLRGAQLRRRPLLPLRRPLREWGGGSRKPPLPGSLRPAQAEEKREGLLPGRHRRLPLSLPPQYGSHGGACSRHRPRPSLAGQRRRRRRGREGDVTLRSAQPRPLGRDPLRRRADGRAAGPGATRSPDGAGAKRLLGQRRGCRPRVRRPWDRPGAKRAGLPLRGGREGGIMARGAAADSCPLPAVPGAAPSPLSPPRSPIRMERSGFEGARLGLTSATVLQGGMRRRPAALAGSGRSPLHAWRGGGGSRAGPHHTSPQPLRGRAG